MDSLCVGLFVEMSTGTHWIRKDKKLICSELDLNMELSACRICDTEMEQNDEYLFVCAMRNAQSYSRRTFFSYFFDTFSLTHKLQSVN